MAKLIFSEDAQEIWEDIFGTKGLGLTSVRTENLVNILERDLGLRPVMCRFGDDYVPYPGWQEFRDTVRIPQKPDEWCNIYYAPQDCERATGSNAHNWTQWAARLLKYGRGSHPFALRMKPPADVLAAMQNAGIVQSDTRTFRFLSIEIVVFYLAVQIRTWGDPDAILTLKDLITKQTDIEHISFIPSSEDVNMNGLFPDEDGVAIPDPKPPRSIPKAGHDLVGYNPTQATRQPQNAPVAAPAVPLDLTTLDDDELDATIAQLQALLEERKARKLRAAFQAEAEQAAIAHEGSQVWPDRGEYATMQVRYPNGKKITYYHQQLMEQKVASADDDLLAALD